MQIRIIILLTFQIPILALSHNGVSHTSTGPSIQTAKILESETSFKRINETYLDQIEPVFKRACFDCHSGSTTLPWYSNFPFINTLITEDIRTARKHLDFSNGFPFLSHASPKVDLEEIKRVVQEDEMPPFRYRVLHWDSSLTSEDKKAISNWADESIKQLGTK